MLPAQAGVILIIVTYFGYSFCAPRTGGGDPFYIFILLH